MRMFALLIALATVALSAGAAQADIMTVTSTTNRSPYVRGYYFTAPVAITILGLTIPGASAGDQQYFDVVKYATAPPNGSANASISNYTLLATANGVNGATNLSINIAAGEIIGILNYDTTKGGSYNLSGAGTATQTATIGGQTVTLYRLVSASSVLPDSSPSLYGDTLSTSYGIGTTNMTYAVLPEPPAGAMLAVFLAALGVYRVRRRA